MELFDEVMGIVKKQDRYIQEIAQRIVAKAKNSIIEAAKDRKESVDINISEEKIEISNELKRHLSKAGLEGFSFSLYSSNPWVNNGPATHLRVMIPSPNTKKKEKNNRLPS